MTAVAVVPSRSARARKAAHTSSGMRTVRAGVFGWLGIANQRSDLDSDGARQVASTPLVGCELHFVQRGGEVGGVDGRAHHFGAVLGSWEVNATGSVGDKSRGDGSKFLGEVVDVHGPSLPRVLHLVKSEMEKVQ